MLLFHQGRDLREEVIHLFCRLWPFKVNPGIDHVSYREASIAASLSIYPRGYIAVEDILRIHSVNAVIEALSVPVQSNGTLVWQTVRS
jgi:hypothetical protein